MKYIFNTKVPFSQTGVTEGFSVIGAAQLIEDSVCAFFAAFGKDNATLFSKYGAMWVFVRNKFQKRASAKWNEEIRVESFFTKITAATVVVDTVVKNLKGETALAARTELCVIDFAAQRIRRIASVEFPKDMRVYESDAGFDFMRFPDIRLGKKYEFTVPSTSIDLCGHVNNVEYLRFILNSSDAAREIADPVVETEINFVAQAREKDTLTVFGTEVEGCEFYEIRKSDEVVSRCRLVRGR